MSGFPSWWLKVGDFITGISPEVTTDIGVILEVRRPGIIRVRWGTDTRTGWYNMNDYIRVRFR